MPDQEVLSPLKNAYQDFVGIILSLSVKQYLSTMNGWAPRDVVAHLIGWNRLMVESSSSILAGDQPAYYTDAPNDYSHINAGFTAKYSSRSKQELLAELKSSLEDFEAFILALSFGELAADHGVRHYRGDPATISKIIASLASDYHHHAQQIREWLNKADGTSTNGKSHLSSAPPKKQGQVVLSLVRRWTSIFKTDKEAGISWRKEWPEWGFIFLFVLFFSHGFLDLGTGNPLPGSEAETYEMVDQALVNTVHSFHQFPQWNFYILGGTPYVADPMFHAFNPVVTLPVLFWGVLDGYKIALFLSFLLAALGTWWLAKTAGMGPAGRLWSACLFACTGQPAIRFLSGEYLFVFGFAWIPWSLASLINAIQTRRRVYVAMSVLSLALLFFSGNVYYAVYMLVIIGLLAIIFIPRFQRKTPFVYPDTGRLKILAVIGVLAFGLVAVQAFPLFEIYPRLNKDMSQLGSHTLQQIVLDLTSTSINRPDARVNLPPQEYYAYLGWGPLLALLLLPLVIWKHPNKRLIIFFGAMLALTIMMIDLNQMPWKDLFARIHFFAQFHLPTRALIYCNLAVIVLSGFVIDTLWNLPRDIWKESFNIFRAIVTGTSRLALAVLMIIFLSITYRRNEIYLHTGGPFPQLSELMQWLRYTDSGVYYVDLYKDYPMSALTNNLWILDPWYHFTAPLKGFFAPRPVNPHPQYLLTGSKDPISYPDPIQIQVDGVYAIFKLPHSLPFAFTISNARFNDPSNPGELTYEDVTPVQVQLPGANRLKIVASGKDLATLIVLTTDYPGWRVTVDGQLNLLQNIEGRLGVGLLPGTHTYEFTFCSTSFLVGLWISLLSLVIIAGLLVGEWQNGFRKG